MLRRGIGAAAVVQAVGLPKPTVFRILATLDNGDWVLREPGGKEYTAGNRLADFGLAVMMNNSVRVLRRTIVARVARLLGETCNLTFLAGDQVVYLERLETRMSAAGALEHVPCLRAAARSLAATPGLQGAHP